MNKKAFTLIELLAVIAVLAIILVIATPQVIKSINNSRNESFITSYKNLVSEVKKRIVEKRTNKDIKIECADSSDLNDEYKELKACDSIYDISPDDYNMYVLEKENVYFVILEGTGKFENIDLTYAWEELAKSSIFPLNHLVDFNISIEENYDKSALLTMLSPFGEVLDINEENIN